MGDQDGRYVMCPGETLDTGDILVSQNGNMYLKMQDDGNVVIYRKDTNTAIWSNHKAGSTTTGHLAFQGDGNLVEYSGNSVIWSSNQYGDQDEGIFVVMQNDGNLVKYHKDGTAVWASDSDQGVGGNANIGFTHCSPTSSPIFAPTDAPTPKPTHMPTPKPNATPTLEPTRAPVGNPTHEPTEVPTEFPVSKPSAVPTLSPTTLPTFEPTVHPNASPTKEPTKAPLHTPTHYPSHVPVSHPSAIPTDVPHHNPTPVPTLAPSHIPTMDPTNYPHSGLTPLPSKEPTPVPFHQLTKLPISAPTFAPTNAPNMDLPEPEVIIPMTTTPPHIPHPTAEPTQYSTLTDKGEGNGSNGASAGAGGNSGDAAGTGAGDATGAGAGDATGADAGDATGAGAGDAAGAGAVSGALIYCGFTFHKGTNNLGAPKGCALFAVDDLSFLPSGQNTPAFYGCADDSSTIYITPDELTRVGLMVDGKSQVTSIYPGPAVFVTMPSSQLKSSPLLRRFSFLMNARIHSICKVIIWFPLNSFHEWIIS